MERTALVRQAARGDTEAFGRLVHEYRMLVYGICLSWAHQPAEAEDLTQEVFVRVYHDLPRLREPDKFLGWLRQVTRNLCRMWHRRQPVGPVPLEAEREREDGAAGAELRRRELGDLLAQTLAQLSPKSREVLVLHYLAGCSEAEIAALLGVRVATVKSRLHEGRDQAKRQLLPVVEELLSMQSSSAEMVQQVLARCGSPGCACPSVLTEGR